MGLLKNVLLTDDDLDDQEFFKGALKEIDETINCRIAHNGKETLEILRTSEELPDVLFLDLNMPLMNGFECLSKLRNDIRFAMLPVVIFTTSRNPTDAMATHQLGANVFLSKPSSLTELRTKLDRILRIDFNADGAGSLAQYSV